MGNKVSAIIPTCNRFDGLKQAVDSVRNQTYKNIEIIVVNDGVADKSHCGHGFRDVVWLDLKPNSREKFGFPAPGYSRNAGISRATGDYVAFLDDDDMWFPSKIEKQLAIMQMEKVQMCCTEGLMGDFLYDSKKEYALYYAEYFKSFITEFFRKHFNIRNGIIPKRLTLDLVQKHNFLINSSVILEAALLRKAGLFRTDIPLGFGQDYDLWKRCLLYTDCWYLNEPLVYNDGRLSKKT